MAHNTQQYLREVEAAAPFRDTYVGHRPATLLHQDVQLRPYIDIDSPSMEDAMEQARRFVERCEKEWSFAPEPFFSANRSVHFHFGHPAFAASSEAYRDTWLHVIRDWNVFIDPQPLRNSRSMPRVPYSINSKSIGTYGEIQFVVPIDVTWDVDDVLRASREVWTRRITVPESKALGQTLQPLCEARDAKLAQRKRTALPPLVQQDLVNTAIVFSESVGADLKGRLGKGKDGRRRVLMYLYVPALCWRMEGDAIGVRERVRSWVVQNGGRWQDYQAFVEDSITNCLTRGDRPRLPQSLKRFLAMNPDLSIQMPQDRNG